MPEDSNAVAWPTVGLWLMAARRQKRYYGMEGENVVAHGCLPYLRALRTFLSCLRSLLVNSVSISRKGRLGGAPAGSSGSSWGVTATWIPFLDQI